MWLYCLTEVEIIQSCCYLLKSVYHNESVHASVIGWQGFMRSVMPENLWLAATSLDIRMFTLANAIFFFFLKLLTTVLQQHPHPRSREMIHLCSRTTQAVQVRLPPTNRGPTMRVAWLNKSCWHLQFPQGPREPRMWSAEEALWASGRFRYLGRSLSKLWLKWLLRKRSRASIHSSRHSFRVIGEELTNTKGTDLWLAIQLKKSIIFPFFFQANLLKASL